MTAFDHLPSTEPKFKLPHYRDERSLDSTVPMPQPRRLRAYGAFSMAKFGRSAPTHQNPTLPQHEPSISSEQNGYCELFSADWWLISCALFMMIFVLTAGSLAIVGFICCVAAIVWRNPGLAIQSLARYSPIWLLSLYVVASAGWSDAPDVTLKQGLEFFMTVACGIIVLRRIAGSDLASALMGPSFLLCAVCLAIQPSAFHGTPLQGFVGSKNLFAFLAQMLLASSIAVLLDGRFRPGFRLFALVGLALGVLDVVLARSAGAWITSVLFVLTFVALRFSERLSLGVRVGIGVTVMALILPAAVAYKNILTAAQNFQEHVLHKDTTLTGRTGLWIFSKSLIAERPVLGHGFAAFWRQGNLDAEGLWRELGIASRTGINFHNQFIETMVDLGYIGLAIFIVILIIVASGCVWRAISKPSISGAFLTAVLVALYARLPVESILIGPWNIFTLLWLGVAIHSFSPVAVRPISTVNSTTDSALRGRPAWAGRRRMRGATA